MKINIIIKANAIKSKQSEVFLNRNILEVGMSLHNLYDRQDKEYLITYVNSTLIIVKITLQDTLIETQTILFETLENNYHWYFLNKGDYIFLTSYEKAINFYAEA